MPNMIALRVRALSLLLVILAPMAFIAIDARASVQDAAAPSGAVATAHEPAGGDTASAPQSAPATKPAAVASDEPKPAPTATERAALDLVAAIQETPFGTWLHEHALAWNAMAIAARLGL